MDKLVNEIASGVGRKRKNILISLASGTRSFNVVDSLIDSDDSSDEDYRVSDEELEDGEIAEPRSKVPRRHSRTQSTATVSKTVNTPPKPWASLPDEILLKVFSHITDLRTLIIISRVCGKWRKVASDPHLWRSLDLEYGWIKSPQKALEYFHSGERLAYLQQLSLARRKEVTPSLIQLVVDINTGLKTLDISGCTNIKDQGMELIAKHLTNLTTFRASQLDKNTLSVNLLLIVDALKDNLQELSISQLRWTPTALINGITNLSQLRVLDISKLVFPRTTSLIWFLRELPATITELHMSESEFTIKTDDDKTTPVPMPRLTLLSAARVKCDQLNLSLIIGAAPKLEHLDVRSWKGFQLDTLLSDQLDLASLKSLDLDGVSFSRDDNLNFARLSSHLERLDVSRISGLTPENFDQLFDSLAVDGSALRAIICRETPIKPDHVRNILKKCAHLHEFGLESCRELGRGQKSNYEGDEQIRRLKDQFCIGV